MKETDAKMGRLIQATAESLWDVSSVIQATGIATEGDWELARAAASHMLAALVAAEGGKREEHRKAQA